MRDLNDVKVFIAVAKLGGFTAASNHLNVTVSTVTKRVQRLEASLGVLLFTRTTRQLSLTALGRRYYERVRPLVEEIEHEGEAVQSEHSALEGRVRISVTPAFGRLVLIPCLDDFLSRNKNIGIDVFLGKQTMDLINGDFDIMMHSYPIADSLFKRKVIATGRRSTVASPKLLAEFGAPNEPSDLHSLPCIVNPFSPDWYFRNSSGDTQRYRFQGPLRSDSGDMVRAAAVEGLGVAQSGWWLFDKDVAAGRLVPILEDYETQADPLYLIFLGRDRIPARVQAVLAFIAEVGEKGWRA